MKIVEKIKPKRSLSVSAFPPGCVPVFEGFLRDIEKNGYEKITLLETKTHRQLILYGAICFQSSKIDGFVSILKRNISSNTWEQQDDAQERSLMGTPLLSTRAEWMDLLAKAISIGILEDVEKCVHAQSESEPEENSYTGVSGTYQTIRLFSKIQVGGAKKVGMLTAIVANGSQIR